VLLTTIFRRGIEEPIVAGSGAGAALGAAELSATARRLQTGLLRTYALSLAVGLGVLTVVFIAVRG
jgi:hypothetical protein